MSDPDRREPAPHGAQTALDRSVLQLEEELDQLGRARSELDHGEVTSRLCRAEGRLLAAECELARSEKQAWEHPVLPVLRAWSVQLRLTGLVEHARRAEALTAELLCLSLRQTERLVEGAQNRKDAQEAGEGTLGLRDQLFDALVATEELRVRVEGRAERIGEAAQADARTVVEEARRVQGALRAELDRAIAAEPPDAQRRDQWTSRLVDHADEALVSALEVDDRIGARILHEAHRTLEWHLSHVEPVSSGGRRGPRQRLIRRMKRLEAERLERVLQTQLAKSFGARRVLLWERTVLLAIALVIGLLLASIWYGGSAWLLWTDTAVCTFLLVDFFVKAAHVGFHRRWLKRHILTDLLPAIPFGLFAINAGSAELAPLLKALRIQKVARSLRLLLPVIRLYRALTFLLRGLDRIVRQNARMLMGETLLFPTPVERRDSSARSATTASRLWALRCAIDDLFARTLGSMGPEERVALASGRLSSLQDASRTNVPITDLRDSRGAVRRTALPIAEELLDGLSNIRSEEVEGRIGREAVLRLAKGSRIIARSPLRYIPFVGRCVPEDAPELSDRRIAARVLRNAARSGSALHKGVLWWADLRGTLTPGELVGRVGSTLVARSARPAVRLLAIGGAYLFLRLLLHGFGFDPDVAVMIAEDQAGAPAGGDAAISLGSGVVAGEEPGGLGGFVLQVFAVVNRLTGVVLVVLGSICLAFLGIGSWMQRLARDTTVFHERVARAQFLHLTESIKARARERDASLLEDRVFRPERALRETAGSEEASRIDEARFLHGLARFMTAGISPPSQDSRFDAVARSVMLYRDLLDGALLVHSDTRATSQLLGNLALQRMISHAGRVDAPMKRVLRGLDLERRRTLFRGPYLWFHSITRALSSRAARLIVDYNAHAIPRSELGRTAPAEHRRYLAWLAREPLDPRRQTENDSVRATARGRAAQLTTAFTALHFLDASPARDAEVGVRFGEEVLARLRSDRRALVRTVFGTSPLHRLPLESRVLNLRLLYADWVEGGRVWFAPFRLMGVACRAIAFAGRSLAHAVATIRRPENALVAGEDGEADFYAATRKIGRMRGPGALAATELRAILDPEYCGLALPGIDSKMSALPHLWADADFLQASPVLRDRLAAHIARAARALDHLEREYADGLLNRLSGLLGVPIHQDKETLRALALIVVADDDGIRSGLFGAEVFAEATLDALRFGSPRGGAFAAIGLRFRFEAWWRRDGGREHLMDAAVGAGAVQTSSPGSGDLNRRGARALERARRKRVKRAAWATLAADVDGAREAFDAARIPVPERSAARKATESRLADALRHPARITEQLVTLRTIQTLSLVDVRDYRQHVWHLGEYGAEGDTGDVLLKIPDGSRV